MIKIHDRLSRRGVVFQDSWELYDASGQKVVLTKDRAQDRNSRVATPPSVIESRLAEHIKNTRYRNQPWQRNRNWPRISVRNVPGTHHRPTSWAQTIPTKSTDIIVVSMAYLSSPMVFPDK